MGPRACEVTLGPGACELKLEPGACELKLGPGGTPCKVAEVTGGKWERLNHKHGSLFVAHVRVDKELADKVASKSGQGAIFTSVLSTKQNPLKPVAWIPKQSDMSREDYWKFAVSLGASQGKPLAIRQGGNADLGIVAGDAEEFPHKVPKIWVLKNSPRHWQSRHVHEFLSSELWTDVKIKTRRCNWRNGYNHEWLFQASEPPGASAAEPYFHYVDDNVYLTVVDKTTFKQPKPREVEWLWGPKKCGQIRISPNFKKMHPKMRRLLLYLRIKIRKMMTIKTNKMEIEARVTRKDPFDGLLLVKMI